MTLNPSEPTIKEALYNILINLTGYHFDDTELIFIANYLKEKARKIIEIKDSASYKELQHYHKQLFAEVTKK